MTANITYVCLLVFSVTAAGTDNQPTQQATTVTTSAAKTVPSATAESQAIDERRLALDERRLAIEEERLALEQRISSTNFWTLVCTVTIPVLSVVAGFIVRDILSARQAQRDFHLKIADVALGDQPWLAIYRASVLAELFPDEVPEKFKTSFDKNKHYGQNYHAKLEYLALVARDPDANSALRKAFQEVFPAVKWLPEQQDVHEDT